MTENGGGELGDQLLQQCYVYIKLFFKGKFITEGNRYQSLQKKTTVETAWFCNQFCFNYEEFILHITLQRQSPNVQNDIKLIAKTYNARVRR